MSKTKYFMPIKQTTFLFVLILIFVIISGCTNTPSQTSQSQIIQYNDITVQEAKAMIDNNKDVLILDVRTESEFAQGHLDGAINIPHFDIEERYKELNIDKNKPIITICTMGGRSRLAAESLSKLEFTNVSNMVGGLNEWYKVYGESNYG